MRPGRLVGLVIAQMLTLALFLEAALRLSMRFLPGEYSTSLFTGVLFGRHFLLGWQHVPNP